VDTARVGIVLDACEWVGDWTVAEDPWTGVGVGRGIVGGVVVAEVLEIYADGWWKVRVDF